MTLGLSVELLATRLARQVGNNYLVNCGLCLLAMTYLLMGDASTAMLLISETNLPPTSGNRVGFERAAYELAYGKADTGFRRWAKECGASTYADGLGMLVEQAAESFHLWRGVRPDTAPVLAQLRSL